MKMTKAAVDALTLPPGKRDHFEPDDEMDNFYVRVKRLANGVGKTWTAQVKRGGKTHRQQFGSTAGPVGLTAARAAARRWLAEIALGKDPQAERRDRRARDARTMGKLVDSYIADKGNEWAPKTALEIARYLRDPRYAGPLLRMPVGSIGLADIAQRIDVIKKEMGAATAANWRSSTSGFFVWCLRRGAVLQNPVINSEKPKTESRRRVLTGDELRKVWLACGDDDYGRIVKLLIATGCRRDEIGSMRWSELDFERGTFVLPVERVKTESSARTIPLLPLLRQIIDGVPRMATRDYLFGRNAAGFVAWSAAKRELDERCGFKDWVVHDIRRTTSTILNEELEVEWHVTELLLGHEFRGSTHGTYNRATYKRAIAAAYALWHDYIRTLIDGGGRKVVSFPVPA
jgi:integrase